MAIFTNEQIEKLKSGWGIVRTQEQIETDLDREYQERMKREQEQAEQERLYKERLEREKEERRQAQYEAHKEIFDFMKVFNELEVDDYYCIVELKDGKQFMAKPNELKRDADFIFIYIQRNVGASSMFENPYRTILETNVNQIKGVKLQEEEKKEIVITKKTRFGKFTE